jgi:hypothetical protein
MTSPCILSIFIALRRRLHHEVSLACHDRGIGHRLGLDLVSGLGTVNPGGGLMLRRAAIAIRTIPVAYS